MNMLGIITYCVFFGLIISILAKERRKSEANENEKKKKMTILKLFEDVNEISMKMIRSVIM